MNLWLAIIFGVGFGFIMQRVGAFEFENIINALRLKDLSIPKFMLMSVAVTSVGVFSLRSIGLISLDLIITNPVINIIGGLIFGIGFAFAGYCPGTSIGAMGEGKRDALYTVLGGIVGVFTYTLFQQYTGISTSGFDIGKISLADLVHLDSFSLSIVYSVFLLFVIFLVDRWEEKSQDINSKGSNLNV
jgi:uncharacterized membrane protein YedE/YeeE